MKQAIIIFYSVLAIWQVFNLFQFFKSMTKEDADDVKNIKFSLMWPIIIFIIFYFGSLFIVGLIENPKGGDIMQTFKRVIQVIQLLVIIVYPFLMTGELVTRALSMEITGAPSSEKRTRTLHSNLTGLMVMVIIVTSIIYIIL